MRGYDKNTDEYLTARNDFRTSKNQYRGNTRRRRELMDRMRGGRGGMGWGFS